MGKSPSHSYLLFAKTPNAMTTINMQEIEYIGYAAGFLTTLAFLPQALKVFRSKKTRDISLLWALLMTFGVFLWFCYGYANHSLPMMIANGITFVLMLVILVFKLRFK